jgi:hypothetical protein
MSSNSDSCFKWYIEARSPLRRLQRKLLVKSCNGKRILILAEERLEKESYWSKPFLPVSGKKISSSCNCFAQNF